MDGNENGQKREDYNITNLISIASRRERERKEEL